jgi:hypothetical protein
MKIKIRILFCTSIILLIIGCATIPKQAPTLSEELGIKINQIEESHLNLLKNFFEQKRALVDDFITNKWIPVFANEFFNNQKIEIVWNEIVSNNNKEERMNFILMFGPKLQNEINKKRLELIGPLDDLEKDLEVKIRSEYDIAKSINNTLTSFLYSASKVDENRERYMKMFGITDNKINDIINQTDSIVGKLVNSAETDNNNEPKYQEYLQELNKVKDLLKTK